MIASSFIDNILSPFIKVVAAILSAMYGYTHSYALSIALVTLMMMLVLLPLTLKSTKSMLEMQKVQPLIKALQAEFKNDRPALNEAMMALYKEHKINPAGGCLPMLLQMPFFMTMWRVLFGLTVRCGSNALNGAEKCEPNTFVPKYLNHSSELYRSLEGKKEMLSAGLDLSSKAYKVIQDNVVRGLPYLALVIVVGLLSYYQQRQMTARQTGATANPQQQMIMNLMPIFFGFISLTFASGLIIYFLVQNVFRIAQNGYITRKFYGDTADTPALAEGAKKPKPTGFIEATATATARPKPSKNITPEKAVTPPKAKPTPSGKAKSSTPPERPKPPTKIQGERPARPTPKQK